MTTLAINELMKQELALCQEVMRFPIRFTYFVWTAICGKDKSLILKVHYCAE